MNLLSLENEISPPKVVLAAIQSQKESDEQLAHSLLELRRLCETLGLTVVGEFHQKRTTIDPVTVFGSGKVKELKELIARLNKEEEGEVDKFSRVPVVRRELVLVFDDGLSPAQTNHLAEAVGAQVLDRNTVILEIFQKHARTRVAQLQVEMVRLEYQAPRVRTGVQRADRAYGIGAKGKGESHLELDRRKVRDRLAELRIELARVERSQEQKRKGRVLPQVALVGYTNAGKSTLMRALTQADVYIADKLFATLDTRIRLLRPATQPPVLVSDTVGFIKKLPHGLINSFKATLDEALDASLLLHVVDASSDDYAGELATTLQVLEEIGAGGRKRQLVFNKIDRLTSERVAELQLLHPEAVFMSALQSSDVARLHSVICQRFEEEMVDAEMRFTYQQQSMVNFIHTNARVLSEAHDEHGTLLRFKTLPTMLESIRHKQIPEIPEFE